MADTVADGGGGRAERVVDGAAVVGAAGVVAVATGAERRPEAVTDADARAGPPPGSMLVNPATAASPATAQRNAVRRRTR